jgi:hypothetical protein
LSRLLLVFSVVPLRCLHLGISTLASAFVLRPSTSVWFFIRHSRRLLGSRVDFDRRRGVLSQMQVLALRVGRGILAVTFRP